MNLGFFYKAICMRQKGSQSSICEKVNKFTPDGEKTDANG